ncbi:hypothetical protein H4S14_004208 [Agrobacterium vitis]|nr:hypothetical protein [Agrobacterium vitis]MBE1440434.1 hypothetical protein [Agrobacterium vitis]
MAESQTQFIYDQPSEQAVRTCLTDQRLTKYEREAGRDFDYMMALYLWNARLCKALQFPIHALEVALRNAINEHILALDWPKDWAFDDEYLEDLEEKSLASIDTLNRSKRRLLESKMKRWDYNNKVRDGKFRFVPAFGRLNTNDVIASLPFEYWVGMLSGNHDADWHVTIKTVFPNLPKSQTRRDMWLAADLVKDLRNRVSHHEPVFHLSNLVAVHQSIFDFVGQKDPAMERWIRHHSTFLQTWHAQPRRDGQKAGRKLMAFARHRVHRGPRYASGRTAEAI